MSMRIKGVTDGVVENAEVDRGSRHVKKDTENTTRGKCREAFFPLLKGRYDRKIAIEQYWRAARKRGAEVEKLLAISSRGSSYVHRGCDESSASCVLYALSIYISPRSSE
jgi:hypothetical protein